MQNEESDSDSVFLMKACPSCGAELEDNLTKCPICDFVFGTQTKETVAPPSQEVYAPGKLEEIRARIQRLAGMTPKEGAEGSEELTPEEPEAESQPEEEIQKEETEGSTSMRSRRFGDDLVIPGMTKKKEMQAEPEKMGYKIVTPPKNKKRRRRIRIATAAVVVVILIVFVYWYFFILTPTEILPSVDGYFDDWKDTVKYQSYSSSDNTALNYEETAVQSSGNRIFWYFSMDGALFSSSSATTPVITTYALFVDSDGNPSTGFLLERGFGADLFVGVSGSSGAKNSSFTKMYEFQGNDQLNWSSWEIQGSIVIGNFGQKVETSFVAPSTLNMTFVRFVAASFDGISRPSATLPFSLAPGILLIDQESAVNPYGIITAGSNQTLLQLKLTGYGIALPIAQIIPTVTGLTGSYNLGPVEWNGSEMESGKTLMFVADTSSLIPGAHITVSVKPSDVVTEYPSVVVIGKNASGYVSLISSTVVIDGFFHDWSNNIEDVGNLNHTVNGDIDITRFGNRTNPTDSFFFIQVQGEMMNGSFIPVLARIPSPTFNIDPLSSTRITGEDVVQIFIDIDPSNDSGAPSPINGSGIIPDYMIEISGKGGIIEEIVVKHWTINGYQNTGMAKRTAISDGGLEVSIRLGSLQNAGFAIVTTDWLGEFDYVTGIL
jgi:hypothetical protein